MKTISVVIPCYNDSNSIALIHERILKVFREQLPNYDYRITYCEDRSPDDGKTWAEIKKVCAIDSKVRGVRNVKNFGIGRNCFASILYGDGDAVFQMFGDLQDPPEYLPKMIREWESGHKVILGVRPNHYYSPFFSLMRKTYYGLTRILTNNRWPEGANGFGLYDKSFIDILKQIDDIQSVLPALAIEYGENLITVPVHQEKGGRDGKSNLNFWGKYDGAMRTITSSTKLPLRIIMFIGLLFGGGGILWALFVFVLKLFYWDSYPIGMPTLTIGLFFFSGVQLGFLGLIGEYILAINNRIMKRPITAVAEKIGFADDEDTVKFP